MTASFGAMLSAVCKRYLQQPEPYIGGPSLELGTRVEEDGTPFVLFGDEGVRRHRVIYGISGSGKSKCITSLCVRLLHAGLAFGVIDPHSDLADDLLSVLVQTGFFTNQAAYNKLWYLSFSHQSRYVPFNWLNQKQFSHHQIAENFVEVIKRAFPEVESGAVNMENIMLASVMVLLANQRPLTDLLPLLSNPEERQQLLDNDTIEPFVRDFFTNRFDSYGKALSESTLRRAFLLSFSPILRSSLGAADNLIDFTRMIDEGMSVIFDLGGLPEQTARFLSVLISVGFEMAMLARATMPAGQRQPYQLVIDEWAQVLSQSPEALSRILDLTRKYGMTLSLCSQNFTQTSAIKASLQNCLQIAFRLGYDDAKAAASRFVPVVDAHQGRLWEDDLRLKAAYWEGKLKHLERGHALVHLNNQTTEIKTVPVPPLVGQRELAMVKEEYARRLLRPVSALQQEEQPGRPVVELSVVRKQKTRPPTEPPSPTRRRPLIADEDSDAGVEKKHGV